MKSKALIEAFLAEPAMAVVGVSRSGKGLATRRRENSAARGIGFIQSTATQI